MKHREFKVNNVKFTIVESNNADYRWQAMVFDTHCNAWVRTSYYANTQSELKEKVEECYENL